MFKNPLKYQQGGSAQNAMQKLVAFVAQNTGLDENTVSQKLQSILSDETSKAQLTNVLESMQSGSEEAAQQLISMFTQDQPEMRKLGGKIQDFVCKHSNGGNIDCGCEKKQVGGLIKSQPMGITDSLIGDAMALKARERMNNLQRQAMSSSDFNKVHQIAMSARNPNDINKQAYWSAYRSFHGMPSPVAPDMKPMGNQVESPKQKLAGMQNGGMVGKRSVSSGKFEVPFLAYMKAYFNSKRTPTVGAATNRKFGYASQNGNQYYLEQGNINGTSADTWVNVTPNKDTVIMQKLPSDHLTPLDGYDREAIMQRMRPDIRRINSQKQGGIVKNQYEKIPKKNK